MSRTNGAALARAAFLAAGCDGLQDRPRPWADRVCWRQRRARAGGGSGVRTTRRPWGLPLSRYSLGELGAEAANALATAASFTQVASGAGCCRDALRPWRPPLLDSFPRDPRFLELAGPVLDLYACPLGRASPLWVDEYVLSADEKTSIQARRRLQSTLPAGPYQAARVEHEYERQGRRAVPLAAWGRPSCEWSFGRLRSQKRAKAALRSASSTQVMDQEPYRSATPRVSGIVDNGSSPSW